MWWNELPPVRRIPSNPSFDRRRSALGRHWHRQGGCFPSARCKFAYANRCKCICTWRASEFFGKSAFKGRFPKKLGCICMQNRCKMHPSRAKTRSLKRRPRKRCYRRHNRPRRLAHRQPQSIRAEQSRSKPPRAYGARDGEFSARSSAHSIEQCHTAN